MPQFARWPDIAHAALIEMKYVKAGDPVPTPEALEKIKAEAIDHRYSSDPALAAGTTGVSSVAATLHRLVLVFHGGDAILADEV